MLTQEESQNQSALALALLRGKTTDALAAISKLADINFTFVIPNVPNTTDFTPLHLAANRGMIEVVDALLAKGANVLAVTNGNDIFTPLGMMFAFQDRSPEMIAKHNVIMQKLIARAPALCGIPDHDGEAPIHRAAENPLRIEQLKSMLNLLVADSPPPFDIDTQTTVFKYTALHHAIKGKNIEGARLLLKKGANPNAVYDTVDDDLSNLQQTALHQAARKNDYRAVCLLMEFGADPLIKNAAGKRPIELTTSPDIEEYLVSNSFTVLERSCMDAIATSPELVAQMNNPEIFLPTVAQKYAPMMKYLLNKKAKGWVDAPKTDTKHATGTLILDAILCRGLNHLQIL